MDTQNFGSQDGMERFYNAYCSNELIDQPGRIAVLCAPRFLGCDYENKTLCLAYKVEDWMLNPNSVMHGGIVSTVFDLTMGLLSYYLIRGAMAPTSTLQVTFLRPIPAGETLIVEAVSNLSGRNVGASTAAAWLESRPDKLVATSSGTFIQTAGSAL